MVKDMIKRISAVLIAIFLALFLLPQSVSQAETLDSFDLGRFDAATKTYKDAAGSGSGKFLGLSVGFSMDIVGSESITLPPDGDGFTYNAANSSDYSKVINLGGDGKTAAEIAAYVRRIQFDGGTAGQQVSVLLSEAAIQHKTFYYGGTGHYYQYVPYSSADDTSWTTAHRNAKNMEYNGRKGYLATVTSRGEDLFIYKTSATVGWLGGTRLVHSAEGAAQWRSWTFDTRSDVDSWYWACGPEAGMPFYSANTYGNAADNLFSETSHYFDGSDAVPPEQIRYYFNWERYGNMPGPEPNGGRGGENCLTTLTFNGTAKGYGTYHHAESGKVTGYSWNDIVYNYGFSANGRYSPKGYFVEFGNLLFGDDGSDGDSGSGGVTVAPIAVDGTVDESFPDWAAAAGLTVDVATLRGRPLPSTLTLTSDVTLSDALTLPGGTSIALDLNGHTLTAPSGKPAIMAESGVVNIEIRSGAPGGSIAGDSGAGSSTGDGENGQHAIDFSGAQSGSSVTIGSGVIVSGGNGGSTTVSDANAGSGGSGILGGDGTAVTIGSGASVTAGNGGNAVAGAAGGGGIGVTGASIQNSGAITGGNGGNAMISPGTAGLGGNAYDGSYTAAVITAVYTNGTDGTAPPSITTALLPDGASGAAYSHTLLALGNTPITWDIAAGSQLPAWATLDTATGVISGTPALSDVGVATFTVTATNSIGSHSKELSLRIGGTFLATPTGLAWGSTSTAPTTVSWSAVENAIGYSVQLYKSGTAVGTAVSVSGEGTTSCNLGDRLKAAGAGSYTYKVVAVSSDTTYANSAPSVSSGSRTFCSIVFHRNGGSGTMGNDIAAQYSYYTLPACGFTAPTGRRFKTWAIGSISGSTRAPEQTNYLYLNTNVYALWENIPVIQITAQPQDVSVAEGNITQSLSASASVSAGTLAYDWFACSSAGVVSGSSLGSGTSFSIPNTLSAGAHYYLCRVSSTGLASVDTNVAAVTVVGPPVITQPAPAEPQSVRQHVGKKAVLRVTASSNAPLTYQWEIDRNDGLGWKTNIADSTSASYTSSELELIHNGYQYRCAVTNLAGTVYSSVFTLVVTEAPEVPNTGDSAMPFVWLCSVLAASCGLAVLRHKRRI